MHKAHYCVGIIGIGLLVGATLHAATSQNRQGHGGGPAGHAFAAMHHGAQQPPAGHDAANEHDGPHCPGAAIIHHALHEMDLTESQRQAVHETFMARSNDILFVMQPLMEAKHELHGLVFADAVDKDAIRAAAADLGRTLGEAAVVFADLKQDLVKNARLTDEQERAFADSIAIMHHALGASASHHQQFCEERQD